MRPASALRGFGLDWSKMPLPVFHNAWREIAVRTGASVCCPCHAPNVQFTPQRFVRTHPSIPLHQTQLLRPPVVLVSK